MIHALRVFPSYLQLRCQPWARLRSRPSLFGAAILWQRPPGCASPDAEMRSFFPSLSARAWSPWRSRSRFAWVIINWRSVILLVIGILCFLLLIAGLILNTIFLVREVKRNERHDSFLNAVTHELKTPITSIRLVSGNPAAARSARGPTEGVLRHHALR